MTYEDIMESDLTYDEVVSELKIMTDDEVIGAEKKALAAVDAEEKAGRKESEFWEKNNRLIRESLLRKGRRMGIDSFERIDGDIVLPSERPSEEFHVGYNGIRFHEPVHPDDCISIEELFVECVEMMNKAGVSPDISHISDVYPIMSNSQGGFLLRYGRFRKRHELGIEERLLARDVDRWAARSVMMHELLHTFTIKHNLRFLLRAEKLNKFYPDVHIAASGALVPLTEEQKMRWLISGSYVLECPVCHEKTIVDRISIPGMMRQYGMDKIDAEKHPLQDNEIYCLRCYGDEGKVVVAKRIMPEWYIQRHKKES